jgi:hypothetical protein
MQKWEYACIRFRQDGLVISVNGKNVDSPSVHWFEYANELGSLGWELVTSAGDYGYILIFKHPKS